MTQQTQFAETNALLAAMDDDDDLLAELLGDMLPGELRNLAVAARRVAGAAEDMLREKRWAAR